MNQMAGKRLLDAAAILQASRAIATGHFSIRQQQFNVYAKTSSLSKALSRQQGHGSILRPSAGQPSKPSAPFSQQAGHSKSASSQPIPSTESTQKSDGSETGDPDLNSEYQYGTAETEPTENATTGQLGVVQEKAKQKPLPDGTIPPETNRLEEVAEDEGIGSKSGISSTDAKIAQRKSEAQIPSQTAAPPKETLHPPTPSSTSDTFSHRPETVSPALSGLPRTKIPKNTEASQGSDPRVENKTNADTFYSPTDQGKTEGNPNSDVLEEPSEEVMSQLFHSPRAGKVLKRTTKSSPRSTGSETTTPAAVDGNDSSKSSEVGHPAGFLHIMLITDRNPIGKPGSSRAKHSRISDERISGSVFSVWSLVGVLGSGRVHGFRSGG